MHDQEPGNNDHKTEAEKALAKAELADLEAQWEQDSVEPKRTLKAQKRPPMKGGLD